MLTTLNKLNNALFSFSRDTFEEGITDVLVTAEAVSTLFHEDTAEFYLDFDLLKSEMWSS